MYHGEFAVSRTETSARIRRDEGRTTPTPLRRFAFSYFHTGAHLKFERKGAGRKVRFESFHGKVLFHTSYSEYFKENSKLLSVADFIALLKPTHPPQGSTGPQALRALLLTRPRHVEP